MSVEIEQAEQISDQTIYFKFVEAAFFQIVSTLIAMSPAMQQFFIFVEQDSIRTSKRVIFDDH